MPRLLLSLGALCFAPLLSAQDPPPAPKPPAPAPAPAPAAPAEAKPLAIGEALPKGLSLRTIDGTLQSLDELRGKVVVLHFWSTTCPYEEAAEPKLNALTAEFKDQGVVVLGVAANAGEIGEQPKPEAFADADVGKRPYAALRAKAKASAVNHPILVDHGGDTLGKRLDAKSTPHCFVFGKDGTLQYSGALDDDPNGNKEQPIRHVANAVRALLQDGKPPLSTTKPYG